MLNKQRVRVFKNTITVHVWTEMFNRNILVWFVHLLLTSPSICQLGRTIWENIGPWPWA